MPLISVDRACLAFGHVALLDHADLQLDAGERVALIGRNGSGKSSLLRAIVGQTSLDDGEIWRAPQVRIAYVPQEPDFALERPVFDVVADGLGEAAAILQAYHAALHAVTEDPSEGNLTALATLQHEVEAADAWRLNDRVDAMLVRLGLDGDAVVATLSGGGIKRVTLARAMVGEPDLLLLDEPTNHLDLDGILWLEELIKGFAGAVMLITHDRVFLDNVATRIVELDRGNLASFAGRFADYQRKKAEQLEAEARADAQFDKFLAQEEVWIRKGIQARRTRNEGRVRRLEALRRERSARRDRLGNVSLAVDRGDASGKMVAELEHVNKGLRQQGRGARLFDAHLAGRSYRHHRAERRGQNDATSAHPWPPRARQRDGAPRYAPAGGVFRPVARAARSGSNARRSDQSGLGVRADRQRTQTCDRLSRRVSVCTAARALTRQIALRRRTQPLVAGPAVRAAGQCAGARRADQ